MSSRHLIDPEIAPMLELLPQFELDAATLMAVRAQEWPRVPPALEPRREMARGLNGAPDVAVLVYDPPGRTSRAAVYHIHGGGMVLGEAAGSAAPCGALAQALGVLVVSVDYRLAPEHPFPAPQEDCLAGYDWLVGAADLLNVDPARIAVTGESAGGGLAAALALMIRDTGRPAPCAQVLVYPMLDHRTGSAEQPALPYTGEFIWTAGSNRFGWAALQGDYGADDARAGWFSPALASDLAGLPPSWIGVGALDLFVAEDLAYAQRLIAAGVPTELHLLPGCIHGFDMMASARQAAAFRRDSNDALARALGVSIAAD